MPRRFLLPALITVITLPVPGSLSAMQGATVAALSPAPLPAPPASVMPTTLDAAIALRVCHSTLRDDSERAGAVAALRRILPEAPWDSVLFQPLPSDVPAEARASIVASPGTDPIVYSRGTIGGAELLHELVHAWQGTLSDTAFATLVETLRVRDAHEGFGAAAVDRATQSVVSSLAWTVTSGWRDLLAQRLAERVAIIEPGQRGALAKRGDVVVALVGGSDWKSARLALTRGLSSRSNATGAQRDWTTWVHVMFLLEAQAYDAQARCAAGEPQWSN